MIVDPDFLDHWRTRMVCDALNDEYAHVYLLRLWAHCQTRRADTFEMPAEGLKALCRFSGDANRLLDVLCSAGFIKYQEGRVYVRGWSEKNASLIAAWENGSRGGRPPKKPPLEPSGNPAETQGKPTANPPRTQTEPIREEKRREEKKEPPLPPLEGGPAPPKERKARKTPLPDGFVVSERVRIWAVSKGYGQLEAHLDAFRRKARANAYAYADWDSAFMEAVREDWAKLRGRSCVAPPPEIRAGPSAAEQTSAHLAQMARDAEAARSPESIAKRDAMLEKLRGMRIT